MSMLKVFVYFTPFFTVDMEIMRFVVYLFELL